jgi:hypothetical protein
MIKRMFVIDDGGIAREVKRCLEVGEDGITRQVTFDEAVSHMIMRRTQMGRTFLISIAVLGIMVPLAHLLAWWLR